MDEFNYLIDDKEIIVYGGPYGLHMRVDYDDVDHKLVLDGVKSMVQILTDTYSQKRDTPL